MEALGLREQPLQADDLQTVVLSDFFVLGASLLRDLADPLGERKRSQLHPGVAQAGRELALLFPVPVFVELLADREFHGESSVKLVRGHCRKIAVADPSAEPAKFP